MTVIDGRHPGENRRTAQRIHSNVGTSTLLTALVPLVVYFASGRWFVRGIAAGAVKG